MTFFASENEMLLPLNASRPASAFGRKIYGNPASLTQEDREQSLSLEESPKAASPDVYFPQISTLPFGGVRSASPQSQSPSSKERTMVPLQAMSLNLMQPHSIPPEALTPRPRSAGALITPIFRPKSARDRRPSAGIPGRTSSRSKLDACLRPATPTVAEVAPRISDVILPSSRPKSAPVSSQAKRTPARRVARP